MFRFLYLDDRIVERGRGGVSPLDRGVLHGEGVFETVRIEGGEPIRPTAHARRLVRGARWIGVEPPEPISGRWLRGVLGRLAREEGVADAVGRITITAGVEDGRARVFAALRAPPAPEPAGGWSLSLAAWGRDPRDPAHRHKTTSYLGNRRALAEARERGADEALFRNLDGTLAEGSRTNLFFADARGALVTPHEGSGLLAGVMRAWVLALARRVPLPVRERPVLLDEAPAFRECFVTSAVRGVVPVREIAGVARFEAGGPATARIARELDRARARLRSRAGRARGPA